MPPLIPDFDLYRELEVREDASIETIEAAWRSLAKRNHPDLAPAEPADSRMTRINVAHDWLADPDRRALYDQSRRPAPLTSAPSREPPTPSHSPKPAESRGPFGHTPAPRQAASAQSRVVKPDDQIETVQAVFRKLELANDPLAYARSRVPIFWVAATALYTAIFAGATVGLTLEVTSGKRTLWESVVILMILVVAVLAGVAMLIGFAYVYYVAARLQRRRDRAKRSR